jgi:predicted DNA binding CopG/RHH family protein
VDRRLVEVPGAYLWTPSCDFPAAVLHIFPMDTAITVHLSKELAAWLEDAAARSGISQGELIRDQLEKARASGRASSD